MKLHTDKQVFTGFYVCVYICSKIFFLHKEPCSKADHASFSRRKIVRVYEQFLYLCGALDTMLSSLCVRDPDRSCDDVMYPMFNKMLEELICLKKSRKNTSNTGFQGRYCLKWFTENIEE